MATLPTVLKTPSAPTPSLPKVKAPKLPAPTKINIKTGSGVPGEFSGAANKIPTQEISKLKAAEAKTTGQLTELSNLEKTPSDAAILAPLKSKVSSQSAAYKKKASDAERSAVDFRRPAAIPKLPSPPSIKVPELNVPSLPSAPSVPQPGISTNLSVPSLPSVPKIPST